MDLLIIQRSDSVYRRGFARKGVARRGFGSSVVDLELLQKFHLYLCVCVLSELVR